jgi:hypothetical protein
VPNHVETGGVVLTTEHNPEAHDPHDREGEQSQPSRSRCRSGPRTASPLEARRRSAQAIPQTLHVPLDELVGAPETGDR